MFSKIISRSIFILLLFITLTPLIYQKKLFYSYDSEKGLFFRFTVEVLLGLWLILILREPSFRPRKTPINVALGFFTCILIIVDVFGVDTYLSVFSNFERMAGLILYLCVMGYCLVISSVINSRKRWLIFGISLAFVAFVVSIKGIIQSYNVAEMTLNSGRVVATVGNANQLASYLILGFFVVGLLITEWILPLQKSKKIVANICLFIALIFQISYAICLLKTSTRGALAGLIVGGGLMLILTFFKTLHRKTKVVVGTALALIFILISGLFYFRKASFIQQNSALNRITRITDSDGTNTLVSRLENYKVAIEGIKAKPILGWGQETYHYVYAQFFNPKLYADATWYDRVHNLILEWLIIGGIVGLLAYLSLWVAVLYQLWRRENRLNTTIKIIISGFLMTYFVGNLSLFDNLLSLMAFMIVVGFIESHSVIIVAKNDFRLTNKWILSGSMIVLIFTLFCLKITCQKAYQTNKMIANAYNAGSIEEVIEIYAQAYPNALVGRQEVAEQIGNMAKDVVNNPLPETTQKRYFEVAKNIMQTEINYHPNYARLQIIYGNLLEAEGNNAEAVKVFEKVQMLSPKRQSNLIQLSMLYAKNKAFEKAQKLLQTAYLLDSHNEEPRVYQAIVYALSNQPEQRSIIINQLTDDALGRYINLVKYSYAITNDLPEYVKTFHCSADSNFEDYFKEWANTAYNLRNYSEVETAIVTYRFKFSGFKFKTPNDIDLFRHRIQQGENPAFVFEKEE